MSKALFPTLACFGPLFIAMGCLFPTREGFPFGVLLAFPGALMTSMAMIILFRSVMVLEAPAIPAEKPVKA